MRRRYSFDFPNLEVENSFLRMTDETDAHGYVIEFKLGTTAVSAIRQIKANHYADRFAGNGKTL